MVPLMIDRQQPVRFRSIAHGAAHPETPPSARKHKHTNAACRITQTRRRCATEHRACDATSARLPANHQQPACLLRRQCGRYSSAATESVGDVFAPAIMTSNISPVQPTSHNSLTVVLPSDTMNRTSMARSRSKRGKYGKHGKHGEYGKCGVCGRVWQIMASMVNVVGW